MRWITSDIVELLSSPEWGIETCPPGGDYEKTSQKGTGMIRQFKQFASEHRDNRYVSYEWSDRVVVRGRQTFAVFGSLAYDVSKMKFDYDDCLPGTGRICVPIHGRYLAQFPHEGESGIMGMYIINRNGKKVISGPAFVWCGWLYTEELNLTNNEIKQNIYDDIARGKNVFYTPAGWA